MLALGVTPLADRLRTAQELSEPEPCAPLTLAMCDRCSLVQILETVEPTVLFGAHYPYFSSVSPALSAHFRGTAEQVLAKRQLTSASLVIEAASNDGYLLRHFQARGIPVLGIDPAVAPAAQARRLGIETLDAFFSLELAQRLRAQGKLADVFLANNVLAHVPDLPGFAAGIRQVLKDDGLVVIECPYVADLVEHTEFDTIYHQHLCYFSITALQTLLRRAGLFLNDVEPIAVHGGSLRLFIETRDRPEPRLGALLDREQARGITTLHHYQRLANDVERLRTSLRDLVARLKAEGRRIVGYGAAAKACTLLSVCGLDRSALDYVVDLNPFKQGKFMPGSGLPIVDPSVLGQDPPDYVLILAWNFADEIRQQLAPYARQGGRFIVPVPTPRIID